MTAANARSYRARLSGDGQWLAFNTYATNLITGVTDTNSNLDIYLVEIATGAKTVVSHAHSSALQTASYGASLYPSLSEDGRFLAFESQGINLMAGQVDGNNGGDVFLFDRTTGTLTLASRDLASPVAGNGTSPTYPPRASISADGGTLIFATDSSNLVSTDINGLWDAFLFQP